MSIQTSDNKVILSTIFAGLGALFFHTALEPTLRGCNSILKERTEAKVNRCFFASWVGAAPIYSWMTGGGEIETALSFIVPFSLVIASHSYYDTQDTVEKQEVDLLIQTKTLSELQMILGNVHRYMTLDEYVKKQRQDRGVNSDLEFLPPPKEGLSRR